MQRIVFALCVLLLTSAAAPAPSRLSWETSYMPSDGDAGKGMDYASASAIYLDGKFSVWYLLGEPVINCTARWKNPDQASMEIDPLGDGSRLIERAQESEIKVYNLLLAASGPDPRDTKYGFGSSKTIAALCDAGVVAQNGRGGFNVAGSPSWDKFLCALPDAGVRFQGPDSANKDACLAMNGKWLGAAEAKQIALGGLKLSDVTALKASLNGVAVMKRAEKRAWREKSAAFKRARTAAYFADFPAREGEGTAGWTGRKNDAMRRLPLLPEKNPSAEQLKTYEAAWRALITENPPENAFPKEWRKREKTLVGGQLQRIKALDKAAAKEDARLFSYITALDRKKENEPVEPDPMAEYRTATPLTPYSYGEGRNRVCGLKRPDGSVVLEYTDSDFSLERCPGQFVKAFDIYAGIRRQENDYSKTITTFYDRSGAILHTSPHEVAFPAERDQRLEHGFIVTCGGSRSRPQVFSLMSKQTLIDVRTQLFSKASGWHDVYPSSAVYSRNGRPAMVFYMTNDVNRDNGCGYGPNNRAYLYLYLDTQTLGDGELCTDPDQDPLNERLP